MLNQIEDGTTPVAAALMELDPTHIHDDMVQPYMSETGWRSEGMPLEIRLSVVNGASTPQWNAISNKSRCIVVSQKTPHETLRLALIDAGYVETKPGEATDTEGAMSERILTCVYCSHEYPLDTPAHGSQVLTDHIKVCQRHPLRKAEGDIALLRSALVGLIGADTEAELRQMEIAMRIIPAPDEDKAASINAIHALLATMTPATISQTASACSATAQPLTQQKKENK